MSGTHDAGYRTIGGRPPSGAARARAAFFVGATPPIVILQWTVRKRLALLGVLALVAAGCGESESESSFTSCVETRSDCRDGNCVLTVHCDVDECKSEIDYDFDGETYKSKCIFGETRTTTTYPLAGGPGTQETRRDVDECFYKAEVDGNDFDEERRCTRVRDCTFATLECDPSEPGDPDCEVEDSAPCV